MGMTTWTTVLGGSPPPPSDMRELTIDAWLTLDEDDEGELVDGRLEEEEVPDSVHEAVVAWLVRVIGAWLGDHGWVFASELKLVVAKRRGRKADVVVYLPGRNPEPRGGVRVAPDILIEVVTPTPRDERRDRVEKMSDYAAFGVRGYWLVDPTLGTLEVFELGTDGRYVRALGATDGRVEIPGAPGLSIDLDALWATLQRLGASPTKG